MSHKHVFLLECNPVVVTLTDHILYLSIGRRYDKLPAYASDFLDKQFQGHKGLPDGSLVYGKVCQSGNPVYPQLESFPCHSVNEFRGPDQIPDNSGKEFRIAFFVHRTAGFPGLERAQVDSLQKCYLFLCCILVLLADRFLQCSTG